MSYQECQIHKVQMILKNLDGGYTMLVCPVCEAEKLDAMKKTFLPSEEK